MNSNAFKMIAVFFAVPLVWLVWGFLNGMIEGRDFGAVFCWIILPFGTLTSLFVWLDRIRDE